MLLAMARDPRVMIIKLSDRLHNMQTLEALPKDKRRGSRERRSTFTRLLPHALASGNSSGAWKIWALSICIPTNSNMSRNLSSVSRVEREKDLN